MTVNLATRRISFSAGFLAATMNLLAMLGATGCGYTGNANPSDGGNTSGKSRAGVLVASSSSINFGSLTVGTSTAQLVTLTDTGNVNVNILTVLASGAGFSASGGSKMTLAPGQAVTVSVNYNPTNSGAALGTLSVASSASTALLQIALSGNAVAQAVQHTVNLNWLPGGTSVIGYFVYRAVGAGGLSRMNNSADPSTAFSDSTVVGGQTYSYAVTSVDSSNIESSHSTPVTITIPAP